MKHHKQPRDYDKQAYTNFKKYDDEIVCGGEKERKYGN